MLFIYLLIPSFIIYSFTHFSFYSFTHFSVYLLIYSPISIYHSFILKRSLTLYDSNDQFVLFPGSRSQRQSCTLGTKIFQAHISMHIVWPLHHKLKLQESVQIDPTLSSFIHVLLCDFCVRISPKDLLLFLYVIHYVTSSNTLQRMRNIGTLRSVAVLPAVKARARTRPAAPDNSGGKKYDLFCLLSPRHIAYPGIFHASGERSFLLSPAAGLQRLPRPDGFSAYKKGFYAPSGASGWCHGAAAALRRRKVLARLGWRRTGGGG